MDDDVCKHALILVKYLESGRKQESYFRQLDFRLLEFTNCTFSVHAAFQTQ